MSKKYSASVLVVTIIIMGIALVSALSISLVATQEKKASMGASKSSIAYQAADTGIEMVLSALIENPDLQLNNLSGLTCSADEFGNHAGLYSGSSGYMVELKKINEADEVACTDRAKEIANIRSIGTVAGEQIQRSIEAGVKGCQGSLNEVSDASIVYGVVLAADGKCWLDRNLGATQVATSLNDTAGYGWLFQWGRDSDGHQFPGSAVGGAPTNQDTPGHNRFIRSGIDWSIPNKSYLWEGLNGINNPCPVGFRLPNHSEWQALITAESITDHNSAYDSSLKLTSAGFRMGPNGNVFGPGTYGFYWTSNDVSDHHANYAVFNSIAADVSGIMIRSMGYSVRCIKD